MLPEIKSLEISKNQTHLFIGGGRDDDYGVARICVLKFDEKLNFVTECQVGPESMSCVYTMERMADEDILFAGGFGSVSVLYFDELNGKLTVLKNFEDIASDEILDLKFYNNVLYALSPAQEEIAKLVFAFPEKRRKSVLSKGVTQIGAKI